MVYVKKTQIYWKIVKNTEKSSVDFFLNSLPGIFDLLDVTDNYDLKKKTIDLINV